MSRGTTFILLKKSKTAPDEKFVANTVADREKECNECQLFERKPKKDVPNHERFIRTEDEGPCDVIDSSDGTGYNIALESTFNSIFGDVREYLSNEYNLDAYDPWRSQLVVDKRMARDMLVAANYMLLEKYDKKMERVMDNPFIEPMGSLSGRYQDYLYKLKFGKKDASGDDEDHTCVIESLKTMLSAYLDNDYPEKYVLYVEIWG